MRHFPTLVIAVWFGAALLAGCSPSYPKDRVTESVEKLIKKEHDLDGKAQMVGRTLYLDISLSGLTTTEPEVFTSLLNRINGAVLAVTRVALSSDADIRYFVVNAQDPSWETGFRIIQRVEDVKSFLYQRISRSDYEDRLIIEMGARGVPAQQAVAAVKEVSAVEFLGRLIVSQINMLSQSNPFLTLVLENTRLEFVDVVGEELVLNATRSLSPATLPLFKEIVSQKTGKLLQKLDIGRLKKVRIIGQNKQTILIDLPVK